MEWVWAIRKHRNDTAERLCFFLENFKHIYLTMVLGCGTILDGTFYFWSLKSVQGRADKCCKSTHR
ncbi:hypothetical protein F6P79_09480 [Streptococcus suis]|nr:hypothetical protein [Streptococcus suis]